MKGRPENLYLDLMKKTLAFILWPEPPIPLDTFNYQRPPLKRLVISSLHPKGLNARVLISRLRKIVRLLPEVLRSAPKIRAGKKLCQSIPSRRLAAPASSLVA